MTAEAPRAVPTALLVSASTVGEAWASECANDLRVQKRGIVGGWPGTIREARSRVLAHMPDVRATPLAPAALEVLARATNDAARRSWQTISEPDNEP